MGRVERDREIARRRSRREKLQKLKVKYSKASNEGEKAEIQAKIRRLSPFVKIEEPAS